MLTSNEQKICYTLVITEADFRRQQHGDRLALHARGSNKIAIMLDALRRVIDAAGGDDEGFEASLRKAQDAIADLLAEAPDADGMMSLMVAGRSMVKIPAARK